MYFNVITLLVQRVTKLISLYYNDNKVSIYLSIYLSIYHRGGGAESFAFSLVSFSFKQPVSTVRVLLSRFNLQQFNVKRLLFFYFVRVSLSSNNNTTFIN